MKRFSLLVVLTATAAGALPNGLSGLTFGIGAGGLTDGFIQGEYDFAMSKFVCLGPELGFCFGDGGGFFAGAAGRLYFIPDENTLAQPHAVFGAGIGRRDDKDNTDRDEDETGVYMRFGGGCDFDIPRSPVSPYAGLQGLFLISDDSDADFELEIGIRVSL